MSRKKLHFKVWIVIDADRKFRFYEAYIPGSDTIDLYLFTILLYTRNMYWKRQRKSRHNRNCLSLIDRRRSG